MPRLKESQTEIKNRHSRGVVKKHMELKGFDAKQFATQLGMSRSSYFNKMKNPELFTLRDLRRMRLSPSDLNEMVNGRDRY